ncbi:MAG TPA: phosphoadenosine phosphosulfate reductase family protein, partial [Mariprofundaceae bacterium]|nr:phosphoadenosine phosphosulfate reductase family protein [Mariprofundaceae bacterium]
MKEKIESALTLLREAKARHGDKLAYSCSLGMEGSVLIDLIARHRLEIPVMTLDTGRLPQATYDAIAEIEAHYGMRIQVLFPDCREVEAM